MLSEKIINKAYTEIEISWEKYLKEYDVKLPSLTVRNSYSLNALVLIYLYINLGKVISKQELTNFLESMGYKCNDVQQARHLAQQYGWYILSGTRGDLECKKYNINAGEYMLKTIQEPYPSYKNMKRAESLNASSWEELKRMYDYRCATCGSKEGEFNFLYPASKTRLQQGHKDPSLPLSLDNTIPQCDFCNRASRNYFVFDNKGRVEKINDPRFVLRSSKNVQEEMLELLIDNNFSFAKKYFNQKK